MGGTTGRTMGVILILAGIAVLLLSLIFFATGLSGGGLRTSGAVLGLALVFIILVVPLVGGGAYLMMRGRAEATEYAEINKERQLLGMVTAQGQVRVADVALQLNATRQQVESWIRDLVGKSLFSGYINWNDGVLYSRDASQMKAGNKCPNCGGQLELAGKGVVHCPYCGAEIFLSQ